MLNDFFSSCTSPGSSGHSSDHEVLAEGVPETQGQKLPHRGLLLHRSGYIRKRPLDPGWWATDGRPTLNPFDPAAASRQNISDGCGRPPKTQTNISRAPKHLHVSRYRTTMSPITYLPFCTLQAFFRRFSATVTNSSWRNLEFFKKILEFPKIP